MPKSKKVILVANDDGVDSQGILVLARELKKIAKVVIVAPDREQSTMGHALTLHKPVRISKVSVEPGLEVWATSGTPADCVYLGLRKILKRKKPDLIVSGINRGVNVGNDIYYSGTVAAAREGAVMDIPAIACSLDYTHSPGDENKFPFKGPALFMKKLVLDVLANGIKPRTVLNVNFPSCQWKQIKGVQLAKQGFRIYADKVEEKKDTRGKPYFWLGGEYLGYKNIKESDCLYLDKKFITITPCKVDVTDYQQYDAIKEWSSVAGFQS